MAEVSNYPIFGNQYPYDPSPLTKPDRVLKEVYVMVDWNRRAHSYNGEDLGWTIQNGILTISGWKDDKFTHFAVYKDWLSVKYA